MLHKAASALGSTQASFALSPARYSRCKIRGSIVVSISACHAEDPGSIPGCGVGCKFWPDSTKPGLLAELGAPPAPLRILRRECRERSGTILLGRIVCFIK